jgi:hypothetical protein
MYLFEDCRSLKDFCTECGTRTITACPSCGAPIQGFYWGAATASYYVPKRCHQCGAPFSWTEAKKSAALELFAEELETEKEQKEELSRDLDASATDQPRTEVAALKVKRWIARAGKETAGIRRDLAVDLASETAKKIIRPGK